MDFQGKTQDEYSRPKKKQKMMKVSIEVPVVYKPALEKMQYLFNVDTIKATCEEIVIDHILAFVDAYEKIVYGKENEE